MRVWYTGDARGDRAAGNAEETRIKTGKSMLMVMVGEQTGITKEGGEEEDVEIVGAYVSHGERQVGSLYVGADRRSGKRRQEEWRYVHIWLAGTNLQLKLLYRERTGTPVSTKVSQGGTGSERTNEKNSRVWGMWRPKKKIHIVG